jgi:hypothetical protein
MIPEGMKTCFLLISTGRYRMNNWGKGHRPGDALRNSGLKYKDNFRLLIVDEDATVDYGNLKCKFRIIIGDGNVTEDGKLRLKTI